MKRSENIKKENINKMLESEIIESALSSINNSVSSDILLKDPDRMKHIRYRYLLRIMRLKEERKEVENNENAKEVVRKH